MVTTTNPLDLVFESDKQRLLNIYCTAGFPHLNSLEEIVLSLQEGGADMVEVGMPYSDPIADGPVIQESNMTALQNGMTLEIMFAQLAHMKNRVRIPIILMGYINPVLQFGFEAFCAAANRVGVSAIIIPDLPMFEFKYNYKALFEKYNLRFIFLVSPVTELKRLKLADSLSTGFLYAVSTSSVTGTTGSTFNHSYFERLKDTKLSNEVMIGFGIHNRATFETACMYARGAIIGSAYIKALATSSDIAETTRTFVRSIVG